MHRAWLILAMVGVASVAGCHGGSSAGSKVTADRTGGGAQNGMTATLHVLGMSCPLCATNIDKQLLHVAGVEKVSVDLGTGEVRVRLNSKSPPTREQLAQAVKQSGFTLDRIEMPGDKEGDHE